MFFRAIVIVAAQLALVSCTSTGAAVTAPTPDNSRCNVSISSGATTFTSSGGSGTVAVSTARDCTWTVTTDAGWVSINGARDGQGEGSIAYVVAANPVPSARSGSIAVGVERVSISQGAAPCRFALSRSGDSIGFGGGQLSVDVATLAGCNWTAAASANWIAIVSGQNGAASGTVGLSIATNAGGRRVADVNVGGQTYTVTQEAAPAPPPVPAPAPAPPPSAPPAPQPPTPSPSPAPAPPAPRAMHVEGEVSALSQSCPDVNFWVGGEHVLANRSTEYKKGHCNDLRNGRRVEVDGVKSGDTVTAERIEIKKDDDDEL